MNENENPDLQELITPDNDLKRFVVNYTGLKRNPEGGAVSVEMIVETFAEDFPEFLMAIAEENWIRGYQQAINDMEEGEKEAEEQKEDEQEDS